MSIQRLSNAGQSGFRYKSLIAGITPVASVPVIGTATAVTFSTASVAFTAPGAYAGSTYTATSSPGGFTGTSASSPITVSGLSGDTAYTFTVTATNATGTSGPSAASNSITTPPEFAPESGYDALATVTLSASAASITFAGIPTGYKHLQLQCIARSTRSQNSGYGVITFNSDTGSNYSYHSLEGDGASAAASGSASTAYPTLLFFPGSLRSADIFGVAIVDILDYANTNKNTTLRALDGYDSNGAGILALHAGAWYNTAAITSMTITEFNGNNFTANSQFALYGVK
jgi:hypothetical protein